MSIYKNKNKNKKNKKKMKKKNEKEIPWQGHVAQTPQ